MSMLLECFNRALFESKRDDFLQRYVDLLNSKGIETNLGQLKSFLLNKFSSEFGMHSLSLGSNFYLAGVTRYYFDGLLTTNKRLNVLYPKVTDKPIMDICQRLDKLIEILRNSYIDSVGTKFDQPEDFGTLPLDKLLKKYNKKIDTALGVTNQPEQNEQPTEIDMSNNAGKDYDYEILYSYDDAKKYNKYTTPGAWCITYGQQHYNSYIKKYKIHYVIFYKKGYENVPRRKGEGFTPKKPHDEYGNSLIAVLQSNSSPKPKLITSRWNHGWNDSGTVEADHAYTTEEFLKVIGCDYSVLEKCYNQWKHTVEENKDAKTVAAPTERKDILRKFKYAQMMINGGASNIQEMFDDIDIISGSLEKISKSIFVAYFNSESGHTYGCLLDKRNLKLDSMLRWNEDSYPRCKRMGNIILFQDDQSKLSIYSIRYHKFLDADGVKRFKLYSSDLDLGYLRYYSGTKELSQYYMLMASDNQMAVLDTKNEQFLKAPNGASIFEKVLPVQDKKNDSWLRRDEKQISDIGNHGYLYLLYDSAARLYYLYDLATNQWIDTSLASEEGLTVSFGNSKHAIDGYVCYCQESSTVPNLYKFISTDGSNVLSIAGYTEFRMFMADERMILFQPIGMKDTGQWGDNCFLYDRKVNKLVSCEGKPIYGRVRGNSNAEWNGLYTCHEGSWENTYLYDAVNHKLMENPYEGGYLFYYYGSDYHGRGKENGFLVYKYRFDPEREEHGTVFIPYPTESSKSVKETIRNKFNTIYENLNKK